MSGPLAFIQQTHLWRVWFGQKKFECIVYFIGPRSTWLGKPDAQEIMRIERCRFQAMAAATGRVYKKRLTHVDWVVRNIETDTFVCGYLPAASAVP